MKKYLMYLLVVLCVVPTMLFASVNSKKIDIENNIQLAETYYMLMLDEGIGTYAQKKSQKYIQNARAILQRSDLSKMDTDHYALQLNTIEKELKDSVDIKYLTLEGFFPLLKYTATSFFFSPEESEVHTLIKSPDYIAIKNATKSLISSLASPAEVVFNSIPYDGKLEKLTFSIFNSESPLSSHTDKDIVTVLNDNILIKQFRDNNISKEISQKLFEAYSGNPLYIVTLTKELSDKREHFYALNAEYYSKDGYSQEKSVSASAYAVDERSNWLVLITVHLCLLLLALFFTYFNQKKNDYKLYSMTLLFFLFGRILPIILVPSIMTFKPDGDTHLIYSTWWIFVMGIAVFVLPVVAIKMFYGRVVEYLPLPDIAGKGEIVGVSIAAGVLAFLTVPYVYAFGNTLDAETISAFILFAIAILLSGFVMGKVLDDNDKMDEKNLVLFAVTSSLLMTAFLHGVSLYLSLMSLLTIVLSAGMLYVHQRNIKKEIEQNTALVVEDEIDSDGVCHNLEDIDLKKVVADPPYQKYKYYTEVFNRIQPIYEGKATYCVLKGDGGAGKTVTAKILIDTVGRTFTENNTPVLFLSSNCASHGGVEIPYSMFYDLLDSVLDMDLFGQREKDEKFDNVINMASKFMMGPVASFLASSDSGDQKSFSKNDIYIFVKQQLEALSQKSTVILFIDDLQWVDTASKDLLKYLMEEFEEGSNVNILFLFTVRDTSEGNAQLKDLMLDTVAHEIGFIDRVEQRQLLEKSFCISPASSRWIADWAAEQNSDKVHPYILVDAVGNLVRSDVFEIKNDRFSIKEDFDFDNPPIPEGPKKEVKQFLDAHREYVEVLSFAAVFGKEFNVSHLSNGLGVSYLDMVKTLDTIARESGFVFDLMDKDDIYQFRSQILLDALRSTVGYSSDGMLSVHVSQSIRHLHALAANTLEQTLKNDSSTKVLMEIANHYYAAGKLHAHDAVNALYKAVDACRGLFEYDDALSYLDKVDEVLSLTKQNSQKSEVLRLLIECDKSNVQGLNADKAAEQAIVYIQEHPTCKDELKFVATRACYDAALQNNYGQSWFAKSSDIAKQYLLTSDDPLYKAEAYHFMALCMKAQSDKEKAEQLGYYEKAIALTKDDAAPTAYAKIANSLAEALSYGNTEQKIKAKDLFLDSLSIKERMEIKDLPGIARTYGGLGRLAFFSSPANIEEAKIYFAKDLKIAEEIGDKRGISQMNSFLGSCANQEELYEEAVVYFDKSIALKNNPFDVHASYSGKCKALDLSKNEDALIQAAGQYIGTLDELGLPAPFIGKDLISIMEKYSHIQSCNDILLRLKDDA